MSTFLQRGQTRTSTRTPEQLEDLRHETLALVTRIGEEKTFAPRAGPLCRWCEYSERCPGSPQRNPDLATWEETLPLTPPRPRRPGERAPARPSHPAQLPLFDAPSVNADS